jgi:hypothetical protein
MALRNVVTARPLAHRHPSIARRVEPTYRRSPDLDSHASALAIVCGALAFTLIDDKMPVASEHHDDTCPLRDLSTRALLRALATKSGPSSLSSARR